MRGRDAPKELAIRECKPIALQWIDAALDALGDPTSELTTAAFAVNFSTSHGDHALAIDPSALEHMRRTFTLSRGVIERSGRYFIGVNVRTAARVFRGAHHIPPAYAIFKKAMYFTPLFAPYDPKTGAGFGPKCRAAMLVHESIHVIDSLSGLPDIHISEWDEPTFSAQTLEQSLHNPSSYASFSAQVFERAIAWPRDLRYGAGRRAD